MNLLSLIIIFLALAICASVAYIAWELTSENSQGEQPPRDEGEAGDPKD